MNHTGVDCSISSEQNALSLRLGPLVLLSPPGGVTVTITISLLWWLVLWVAVLHPSLLPRPHPGWGGLLTP